MGIVLHESSSEPSNIASDRRERSAIIRRVASLSEASIALTSSLRFAAPSSNRDFASRGFKRVLDAIPCVPLPVLTIARLLSPRLTGRWPRIVKESPLELKRDRRAGTSRAMQKCRWKWKDDEATIVIIDNNRCRSDRDVDRTCGTRLSGPMALNYFNCVRLSNLYQNP